MNYTQMTTSILLTGALFLSASAVASELEKGLAMGADSVLLKNENSEYIRWNGIGKIFWGNTPMCTASLLDTRSENNNTAGPAYLLTAAHCVDGVYASSTEPLSVKFNYFNDTPGAHTIYTIKETVWKDYKQSDLAIMELDVTFATLLADGISSLQFAPQGATASTDVLIVGAPQELPETGLRLAACTQVPTAATLVEGDRAYLNTFKNRCREIRPGSSGSPVLDRKSGHILGVVTTGTHGATIDEKCFSNAPCEVKDGQPAWSVDTSYSHPATQLSNCFKAGIFISNSSACTSDSPFTVLNLEYWPTQYVAMPRDATSPDPVINVHFSLDTPYYRFKTVRDIVDCRSPHHYSGTFAAKDAVIDAPMNREPGMHYLCVIGVESSEQRPSIELMKSAWIVPAQLIERTAMPLPEPTITLTAQWNYEVKWLYRVPTYFGTLYYAGPAKDTDCGAVKISDYISTFEPVHFKAEQLPLTLCSRNRDLAGRHSKVRSDLLALP